MIRKLIEVVPSNFDRDKVVDTRILCKLRELAAVAKGVGQEEHITIFAKLFSKEVLTIQELSCHRLS